MPHLAARCGRAATDGDQRQQHQRREQHPQEGRPAGAGPVEDRVGERRAELDGGDRAEQQHLGREGAGALGEGGRDASRAESCQRERPGRAFARRWQRCTACVPAESPDRRGRHRRPGDRSSRPVPRRRQPRPAAAHRGPQSRIPGAPGAGDPYFPLQGNGGYDVRALRLIDVAYHPATGRLPGQARITARATHRPVALRPRPAPGNLHVRSVRVDGRTAELGQPAALHQELVITPERQLRRGRTVPRRRSPTRGEPHAVHDPDGSLDGFIHTDDGAFVAVRAAGLADLVPGQRHPGRQGDLRGDDQRPEGLAAVSNGGLRRTSPADRGARRGRGGSTRPISSYLVTATHRALPRPRAGTRRRGSVRDRRWTRARASAWTCCGKLPAIVDVLQ